tara:strand:+ start:3108 stop:4043 length:936 start_codon:yes stop_codon:yes gene_type:complete
MSVIAMNRGIVGLALLVITAQLLSCGGSTENIDFEAEFSELEQLLSQTTAPDEKLSLFRELFDFLDTPSGYNSYVRTRASSLLVREYMDSEYLDDPDRNVRRTLFRAFFAHKGLMLSDADIDEPARRVLQTISDRSDQRPTEMDILLLGVYEIEGYEDIVESVLVGVDVDELIQDRVQSEAGAWLETDRFSALLMKARHGDQSALNSLLSYYEALHSSGRGAQFYWLRLANRPEVLHYLLSYAFSDEITEGRPAYYFAPSAIETLTYIYTEYPFPNFYSEVGYSSRDMMELGRQWILDTIDPTLLGEAGVL